jgi:hypothetical protein
MDQPGGFQPGEVLRAHNTNQNKGIEPPRRQVRQENQSQSFLFLGIFRFFYYLLFLANLAV